MTNHFLEHALAEARRGEVDRRCWTRAAESSQHTGGGVIERYAPLRARELRTDALATAIRQKFDRVSGRL